MSFDLESKIFNYQAIHRITNPVFQKQVPASAGTFFALFRARINKKCIFAPLLGLLCPEVNAK